VFLLVVAVADANAVNFRCWRIRMLRQLN